MNGNDSKPLKLRSATLTNKLIIFRSFIYFVQLTENHPGELSSYMNYNSVFLLLSIITVKNSHPVFHCGWRPFYSFGPALRSSSYHWEKEVSCSWISATTAFDILQARLELPSLYILSGLKYHPSGRISATCYFGWNNWSEKGRVYGLNAFIFMLKR